MFYISDILKFQNIKPIVYSTLQSLPFYYFRFRGQLVFVDEVLNITETGDKFIQYDKNFKIKNKTADTTEETLNINRYVNFNDKLYEMKYV